MPDIMAVDHVTPMVTWSKFKPVHTYVHMGISSPPISALLGVLQSITYLSGAAPSLPTVDLTHLPPPADGLRSRCCVGGAPLGCNRGGQGDSN